MVPRCGTGTSERAAAVLLNDRLNGSNALKDNFVMSDEKIVLICRKVLSISDKIHINSKEGYEYINSGTFNYIYNNSKNNVDYKSVIRSNGFIDIEEEFIESEIDYKSIFLHHEENSRYKSNFKLSKVTFIFYKSGILSLYYYYNFLGGELDIDASSTFANQACENDGPIYRGWLSELCKMGIVTDLSSFPLETPSLRSEREELFELHSRTNSWHSNWFMCHGSQILVPGLSDKIGFSDRKKLTYLESDSNTICVNIAANKVSEVTGTYVLSGDDEYLNRKECQIDFIEIANSDMTIRYLNECGEKNALIAAQRLDEFFNKYGKKSLKKYQRYKILIITRRAQ
ncbi:hypothetical protein OEG84_22095 [Hoeflea sp. G2-23]|uniref:Uncharacterized protein n=1 Tax=Hoeflea algicola TaxID=2983763 RepID=A0ABT3ZF49_9HYPH|nr:hypothetical protein [Hoeflea algicola]MCY0150323.1 hypothetical protein [Hoeflea algicola]